MGVVAALAALLWSVLRDDRPAERTAIEPTSMARSSPASDLEPARTPVSEPAREAEARPGTSTEQAPEAPSPDPDAPPPPGTLEIVVLDGETPIRIGEAWLLAGDQPRFLPRDVGSATPDDVLVSRPDLAGVFRFTGLTPGPYRAAVHLPDLDLERSVTLREGRSVARQVWHLGRAILEGHAHDDRGDPLPSALVRLSPKGMYTSPDVFDRFATTDASGGYRFARVAPGTYWASLHPDGSLYAVGVARSCEVPSAGVVQVDFGLPSTEGTDWSGVVRNEVGDPVSGPGTIHVDAPERGAYRPIELAADGSFALRVAPGPVSLQVCPAGTRMSEAIRIGPIDVPDERSWAHDLVIPGTRLRVQVTRPPGWEGSASLGIRPAGGGPSRALAPLPDDVWVVDGLAPGKYVLGTHPLLFAGGEGEFPVTIQPGILELPVEVQLSLW